MNDEELKSLLRSAEADLERSTVAPGELVRHVRRLDERRRRQARMLLVGAPLVLLATIAVGWSLVPRPLESARQGTRPAFDVKEIERLQAEAEYHQQAARQLMTQIVNAQSDPLEDIREQVDVVAYQIVLRADELEARRMTSSEAIEMYRKVVRLFPNTYSAEVARKRLLGLGASAEET